MNELKRCPFCGSGSLKDCYVYIKCMGCGAEGPKQNKGNNDDHADHIDHQNAIAEWNTRIPCLGSEELKPELLQKLPTNPLPPVPEGI